MTFYSNTSALSLGITFIFVLRRDTSTSYILVLILYSLIVTTNYCITVYADKIGPAIGVHFRRIHVSFSFSFSFSSFFTEKNYAKEVYHEFFPLSLLFKTLNPT